MEIVYAAIVIVCPGFNALCLPFEIEISKVSTHQECVERIPTIRREVEYRIASGYLPHDAFIHANVCERR